MVLLDTNYLIRLLIEGSREAERIRAWVEAGEELSTSVIPWYEFLRGPVDDRGVDLVRWVLHDRILPFTMAQAQESSRLFNACGRKRNLRVDAMIAAAAIVSNVSLATANVGDFSSFVPLGLRLVEPVL